MGVGQGQSGVGQGVEQMRMAEGVYFKGNCSCEDNKSVKHMFTCIAETEVNTHTRTHTHSSPVRHGSLP